MQGVRGIAQSLKRGNRRGGVGDIYLIGISINEGLYGLCCESSAWLGI